MRRTTTIATAAAMAAAMAVMTAGGASAQQAYIPEHLTTNERLFLMDCWLANGLTSHAMVECKAELARKQEEARRKEEEAKRKEQERRRIEERSRRAQERLDALNRGESLDPCRTGGC